MALWFVSATAVRRAAMKIDEMVHGAMWFTRAGLAYQLALAGGGRALILAGRPGELLHGPAQCR